MSAVRYIRASFTVIVICGLLGPNGAGKTTAVRILTTLAAPDAGAARVAGIDMPARPGEARRVLGPGRPGRDRRRPWSPGGAQLFASLVDPGRLDQVRAHVWRVAGAEPAVDEESRTVQAPTAAGPRAVSALADALADDGIEVEDIGLRQPTPDDVFLTLTGTPIVEEVPVEVPR